MEIEYDVLKSVMIDRLKAKYNPVPKLIHDRAFQELEYICNNKQVQKIINITKISDFAAKYQIPLVLEGTSSGSLILYLLGVSICNPLPAHYICHNCHQYEFSNLANYGLDLPIKICSDCGKDMIRDGYNIPLETIWHGGEGILYFNFMTIPIFLEMAEEKLKEIYGWDQVVTCGIYDKNILKANDKKIIHSGFYILPDDKTIEDYMMYKNRLSSGEICLLIPHNRDNGDIDQILMQPLCELEELKWFSDVTLNSPNSLPCDYRQPLSIINSGILKEIPFMPESLVNEFLKIHGTMNIEVLVGLYSAHISSYKEGYNPEEYLINQKGDINKYLCDREDAFSLLQNFGIDIDTAATAYRYIWKGMGYKAFVGIEDKVPEWFKIVADNVLYLFPRAHVVPRMIFSLQLIQYRNEIQEGYKFFHTFNKTSTYSP